jgi:hypothetical protein
MTVAYEQGITPSRSLLKPDILEICSLFLLTVLVGYRLFAYPPMGMADNGDFSRFLTRPGLEHVTIESPDNYFYYFDPTYRITTPGQEDDGYRSSTEIFVRAARGLSLGFVDKEYFDIRVLGVLYLALFLVAIYLALLATRRMRMRIRAPIAFATIFLLTDAGYIAYFNTFYSEPTAMVSLLLALGCALLLITRSDSWVLLVGYFAASAILITAKPMCVVFALPLALFGVYLSGRISLGRRFMAGIALACALCILAVWYNAQSPQWLRLNANYIAIFQDLLPNSKTPDQDLDGLGLDFFWIKYTGVSPYGDASPLKSVSLKTDFEQRIHTATIAKFYLERPARLFDLCRRCASHTLITRVDHLGYYTQESGKPFKSQPPGPWSEIRDSVFPKNIWMLAGFLIVGTVISIIGLIKHSAHRAWYAALGTVLAIGALQFAVPVLSVGEPDVERHLFLYSLVFDIVLISLVAFLFGVPYKALFRKLRRRQQL